MNIIKIKTGKKIKTIEKLKQKKVNVRKIKGGIIPRINSQPCWWCDSTGTRRFSAGGRDETPWRWIGTNRFDKNDPGTCIL